MRPQVQSMEELLNQRSTEKTSVHLDTKKDDECADGKLKPCEKQQVFIAGCERILQL